MIYLEERLNELKGDTKVEYKERGGDWDFDVQLTNTDWSMTIFFNLEANELVFETVMRPNKWLAIGLANNLLDADVI